MTIQLNQSAREFLSKMTLDEKLAQLGSYWVTELLTDLEFDEAKAMDKLKVGIGQITRLGGSTNFEAQQSAQIANQIQKYLLKNTRLGIPAIIHEECCSGHAARGATIFPQAIGVACTWEPELVERMAALIQKQIRSVGAHQGLSPLLDITRDPRWGRVEETYGEDPYLVSALGKAFVEGLQGKSLKDGIIATAKHFVGYGLPTGGKNWAPPLIPARELREVFMAPFESAVREANLKSVMNAYSELDGVPCVISKDLFRKILRDEWGFDGFVVSDYWALDEIRRAHRLTDDAAQAAAWALEAGIDVELPTWKQYNEPLKHAVETGLITEALVDQSVRLILEMKEELGLFENPYVDPEKTKKYFDAPENKKLAREAAQKSIVLLKNTKKLLPLNSDLESIAVIGPNSHAAHHMLGDYSYFCAMEGMLNLDEDNNAYNIPKDEKINETDISVLITSVFEAIKAKLTPKTKIHYSQGCEIVGNDILGFEDAVELARNASVAIVVVGEKSGFSENSTCGEHHDSALLNLPGVQEELIQAIYTTGTPVIAVLINGRPLNLSWLDENIPVILEAWLPGEQGAEAIADVLFGDVNPGGKLAITFPRSVGQIPIYYRSKPTSNLFHHGTEVEYEYVDLSNKPLYPFGYGLSYTTFALSGLLLSQTKVSVNEKIVLNVDVTNTGKVAGSEVIQLYSRDLVASVTRPVKELNGFKRVYLDVGKKKTVQFTLYANQFGFYDRDMRYVLEGGMIQLMVGTSSENLPLEAEIEIIGDVIDIEKQKVFFSDVDVLSSGKLIKDTDFR
jgi:beta-glucosidase